VVIADVSMGGEGTQVADSIEAAGRRALLVEGDLTAPAFSEQTVNSAIRAFGRIDILVNNAGGSLHEFDPFDRVSIESIDRVIAANLHSQLYLAQKAAPHLLMSDQGRVINVASELAFLGDSVLVAYATAKAGVTGLTRSLARTLAPTVCVNTVAPGPIATANLLSGRGIAAEHVARGLMGRLGEPSEVAAVIVFLAGSGASYVTGQAIRVDGGVTMG
jgi:3-oxoacyl-[acyl-carrier protein] reductase